MVYRISLLQNPRLFLIFLIIVVLPPAGIFGLLNFGLILGLAALGFAGLFDYFFIKYIINILKSRVITSEDGISCTTSMGEAAEFQWEKISHAGVFQKEGQGKSCLFIYSSETDRLIQIPQEYSLFDELAGEIKDKTDYLELTLSVEESLEDHLKGLLKEDLT